MNIGNFLFFLFEISASEPEFTAGNIFGQKEMKVLLSTFSYIYPPPPSSRDLWNPSAELLHVMPIYFISAHMHTLLR